jgi:two-component system, OmpR family, response regulator
MRILIVSKDITATVALEEYIKSKKFSSVSIQTLDEARAQIKDSVFNLVLVHWQSETSEKIVAFTHEIKNATKKISLIVYGVLTSKMDEITALNGGADDFVKLPFDDGEFNPKSLSVLSARIDARVRFGGTNVIAIDDLVIDPDEEKIFYLGKEIELKGKPFEVLTHLAKNRDQIVSKGQLLDAIWEEPELVTPNVIEVAINQIRQKMDKPLNIGTIETVRRRGYRFCFPNCTGES